MNHPKERGHNDDDHNGGDDGGVMPRDCDILSGRGKTVRDDPGSVQFWALVAKYKMACVACRTKPEKTTYAQRIVNVVNSHGIRFLKQRRTETGQPAAPSAKNKSS
ncbi:hypothetical protein ACA910_009552 [Epithemia clementina (nom. ined.)]